MNEESPQSTSPTMTTSDTTQQTTTPTMNLFTDRPPSATEPKPHHPPTSSIPTTQNSTHSLLSADSPGGHNAQPSNPTIPTTASSVQVPSETFRDEKLQAHLSGLRWDFLRYLVNRTAAWVMAGILVMLFGIAVTDALVLPHIHTCPSSASCPRSYDPNTGNALQLLQSFMSYWLKAGVMISSVGILRLSSYQAWFTLMHQGSTLKNLDLTLGAIRGSLNDAFFLLFRKNNRLLSVFVFTLLGIGAAISLVIGLSIEKVPTTLVLEFSYNVTVEMPDSLTSEGHLNNAAQLEATSKVTAWALDRNKDHDGALRGSLVFPDSRSMVAANATPGGPKITGWFECEGWGNYTIKAPTGRGLVDYIIGVNGTEYIAHADEVVFVASTAVETAVIQYLWVSNTTGILPNATTTSDGKMNIALCTHWVAMEQEDDQTDGIDVLVSSQPQTTGCDSHDLNVCVADSVSKAILSWWGGIGGGFWRVRCRGGVLGPIPSNNDTETYCAPTQDFWKETTTSMLDGIMQTASRSGEGVQDLHAVVEGISKKRWWANAVIPAAILVVYLVGLAHTCVLSRGDKELKELNLHEIVKAAQTDHIRDLALMGGLKGAVIRYDSNVGFVEGRVRSTR